MWSVSAAALGSLAFGALVAFGNGLVLDSDETEDFGATESLACSGAATFALRSKSKTNRKTSKLLNDKQSRTNSKRKKKSVVKHYLNRSRIGE